MSILGLTIDYGPYGWLEDFDPRWTPNTTDAQESVTVSGTNRGSVSGTCYSWANALYPIVEDAGAIANGLEIAAETYKNSWQAMMAGKLGLNIIRRSDRRTAHRSIKRSAATGRNRYDDFLPSIGERTPTTESASNDEVISPLLDAYYDPAQLTEPIKQQIATGSAAINNESVRTV